jgi:hypothetical protein
MSDAPSDQSDRGQQGETWVAAGADEMPTPDEEAAAERAAATAPDVSGSYQEMAEIGADVRGEGQIETGEG